MHRSRLFTHISIRAVLLRRFPHTISTSALFKIANLGQRWILAARAQQVAEGFELDSAGAALVEQREGFFVVCAGLGG